MIEVDFVGWKRFIRGMDFEIIGPFTWHNRIDEYDSIREYKDGEAVVARMTICDECGHILEQHSCEKKFEVRQNIIDATSHFRVLTEEEWEGFDEVVGEGTAEDTRKWLKDRGQIQ